MPERQIDLSEAIYAIVLGAEEVYAAICSDETLTPKQKEQQCIGYTRYADAIKRRLDIAANPKKYAKA